MYQLKISNIYIYKYKYYNGDIYFYTIFILMYIFTFDEYIFKKYNRKSILKPSASASQPKSSTSLYQSLSTSLNGYRLQRTTPTNITSSSPSISLNLSQPLEQQRKQSNSLKNNVKLEKDTDDDNGDDTDDDTDDDNYGNEIIKINDKNKVKAKAKDKVEEEEEDEVDELESDNDDVDLLDLLDIAPKVKRKAANPKM